MQEFSSCSKTHIMNEEEAFKQEDDFQPYLLKNHYTFIGPENEDLFEDFYRTANKIAPPNPFSRSMHEVLSNKHVVKTAIKYLSKGTPLKVYVMIRQVNPDILIHASIEDYCDRFKVDYP